MSTFWETTFVLCLFVISGCFPFWFSVLIRPVPGHRSPFTWSLIKYGFSFRDVTLTEFTFHN